MSTPPRATLFTRSLARLVMVHEGEGWVLFLATSYFFLLLFGYYLLRPMREAFGIARGADKLPWLMTGTLAVMFLANPAFAALVSRFPRRRAIPMTYRFSALCLGLFYLLFRFLPNHGSALLGYAFYIWLSVFNLFAVAVFWAFMADGFDADQGKRLFGFIAMGGTLGAMAGASVTATLARTAPRAATGGLLLVSILSLELVVLCVRALVARWHMGPECPPAREPGPGIFEGLRLFARSPYLALIGLYLLLLTITATFLYLQQGAIIARTFPTQAGRTAAFARIDQWVNGLTLLTQVFLTSRLITRLGIKPVLCLLPLFSLAGFALLWALPTFAILAGVQVLRRGLHYAVVRPVRESLFIPLGPEEKYKAKPFIDTFLYRAGDVLGTWTPALLTALALPLGGVALGVSGVWLCGGVLLGRLQGRLAPEAGR